MKASEKYHTETVKIIVEQEGIDVNAKNVLLHYSMFVLFI